jgi:phosphatidylglycerol:prolipoprotein diacylglycerol transferase
MINFLHTFQPQAILIEFGPFSLRWYGLFIAGGVLAGLLLSLFIAERDRIKKDLILDLSFWLIIGGILGARIYEVLLEWSYYKENLIQIPQIWQGGLAIHGTIIGGLITLLIFSRIKSLNFWRLSAICVPGLALGQAIGRWGNYFNQELFGKPSDLPWSIPIHPLYRPLEHLASPYFHPSFLYESLGCLLIAALLLGFYLHALKSKKNMTKIYVWLTAAYMILYSVLRFGLEFIRLDETVVIWGWRWPQIISLIIILAAFLLIFKYKNHASSQDSPT